MKKPTHDAIEHLAYHLWTEEGCPDGRADDLWLKAERAMTAPAAPVGPSPLVSHGHPPSQIAAESASLRQRKAARTPAVPRKGTTERAAPPESGKPVWPQHASS